MPERLLNRLGIGELEKLFDDKRGNVDVLTSLVAELSHRNSSRARDLRRRVLHALSLLGHTIADGAGQLFDRPREQ